LPLLILLALILLGVVVIGARERIAAWAATEALAMRYGLPSKLAISEISTNEARIDSVALGADGQIAANDITLQFQPTSMKVDRIEIGRIDVHARYDGHVFSLGEADPLLRDLMAPGGDGAQVPSTIILHKIVLDVETPLGTLSGDGMATIDHNVVYSQFTVNEAAQRSAIHLDLNAALGDRAPQPQGKVSLDLNAGSVLWDIAGLPHPNSGAIHVEAQLKAPPDSSNSGVRLATGVLELAADWSISGQDLMWPEQPAPAQLQGTGRAVLSERRLEIPNFDVKATGAWSADFAAHLDGAGLFNLDDEKPTVQATADVSAQTKGLAGGAVQFRNPSFDLGLQIGFADGRLSIQPSRDGNIKFAQASFGPGLKIDRPTTIAFKKTDQSHLNFPLRSDDEDPVEGVLSFGALAADISAPNLTAPLHLAIPSGSFTFSSTPSSPFDYAFDAKNVALALTQSDVAMHNLALGLKSTAGKVDLTLNSDAVTGGGLAQGTFDGKATLDGSKLALTAKLGLPKAQASVTGKGSYDIAQGKGRIDLEMPQVVFAPGGLQPADLIPALAHTMDAISGGIAFKGPVTLDKNGVSSEISLDLQNISGKVGPTTLKNLNSVIEIDRPWPFTTAADQIMSLELADVGLPLTNGVVRFKIDDGSTLAIAESHLEMMSGHVTLDPVVIKFGAPAQQIHLNVDKVSLAKLFELFAVTGLSGDGVLSGSIPVTLFPAGLAIDHAKLEAEGPGVLRYDQTKGPAALQGAGDNVKMAISALSDFHYDKLEIDLDRAVTGDTELGLHIAGRNPSFYNGYPVEFNLAVTGRLDEALRKGLAGYQVPDMIRERLKQYNQ
jgi:hypothetical protein